MKITLQFLGATRTVTGSKFLLAAGQHRVLIDCGLFQGLKELRLKNWEPLPVDPASIDALLLTHAHIDHTGYVPRLVQEGFRGAIYSTAPTYDLCQLLLPDAGRLQEEDARLANRRGFSKHSPALPLFTEKQARWALRRFKKIKAGEPLRLGAGLTAEWLPVGHILGACCIRLKVGKGAAARTLLFSGDVGRYDRPILLDPAPVASTDVLVLESTYGDRRHSPTDPKLVLAEALNRVLGRGGRVVIPAFAVGRTQELLYLLRELQEARCVPQVPIYVDSPMAIAATARYVMHPQDHDHAMREAVRRGNPLKSRNVVLVRQYTQSVSLSRKHAPAVMISASGMATGGRVLNHLVEALPDERNMVLFAGFQAAGTRGRRLLEGEREVKIHGRMIPVNAEIARLDTLSGHADYEELLRWLGGLTRPPERTFLVHGEEGAMQSMRGHLEERFGWRAAMPEYMESLSL